MTEQCDPAAVAAICDTAVSHELDARGLACPLPLLRAKVALRDLTAGDVLRVRTTDIGAWRDIPAYADISGHRLLARARDTEQLVFLLQKS